MNKKNGFTLVELLAVIVILAIVLVIAVPQILNVITESRKGALISSAMLIASTAETKKLSNDLLEIDKVLQCSDVAKINDEDYSSCIVSFDDDGNAQVTIIGKGKLEGMGVCPATKDNVEVKSNCETMTACFSYTSSNAGVTITDYDVDNTDECPNDVIIPIKVENKSVTSIANSAFSNNQLTSVIIPNSVTFIGGSAFYNNQLTSVIIPDSVTTLANAAFYNNQLKSVIIGNSVTYIGSMAFQNNQLTSVTIPDSVTSIGGNAFYNNQITSVIIPDSVTSIGGGAFNDNKLKAEDAFIYKRNSDGTIDNTYVVSYGGAAKDIIIPNWVTTIGDSSFARNQLTSVIIPDSVTYIGNSAFWNNQLKSLIIGNSVTYIGDSAFWNSRLTSVIIPDSVITIGVNVFERNQLKSVTIGNKVETIGNKAFYKTTTSNPNLTSIINTTEKEFDWSDIITDSSGTSSVTGTYNGVNVTTE